MTVSANIKCDVCEHMFTLKSQMDDSIHLYDWPIEIVCPECNNHMHLTYGAQRGLQPSQYICKEVSNSTHIGYSASLPICKEMYYTDHPFVVTPFSSAFLNLFYLYGPEKLNVHKTIINNIFTSIIPYKNLMKELLPFVNKDGNPEYLLKKLTSYFNKENNTKTTATCLDIYNNYVSFVFKHITSPEYVRQRGIYMNELHKFVESASKEQMDNLIECSSNFQNIDEWLIKSAYPYIADIINHIEQYLPAFFFSSLGDFDIPHAGDFNILTIDEKQVSNDYARGFEELMKIIPFMVGLHNLKDNGDCNHCTEGDTEYFNALERFANKTNGDKKKEIYNSYPSLKAYFEYTIENHIRNGKNHEDEVYDVKTQNISYHFNANRADAIHTERLIDVSFRVYLQLLVMVEITILINHIIKKLNE